MTVHGALILSTCGLSLLVALLAAVTASQEARLQELERRLRLRSASARPRRPT